MTQGAKLPSRSDYLNIDAWIEMLLFPRQRPFRNELFFISMSARKSPFENKSTRITQFIDAYMRHLYKTSSNS